MKYTVVSPVKNEAKYIKHTLDSVAAQTEKPNEWIIVDDGSTDNTLAILQEYSAKHDWIKVLESKTQLEARSGGSKVVRAFNKGFRAITDHSYDFIVKLDGDLALPENYFETVIKTFTQNPKVGICGGYILNKTDSGLVKEIEIDYHVRGAFKSVRKTCFDEIGGFKEIWNWDGIDMMEAMMRGWETKVFDLSVVHFRPTSTAYNPYKFHFKDGRFAFKLRTNILLLILRTIGRLKKKPFLISSLLYFIGYFFAMIRLEERIIEKDVGAFTNKFHINRILGTKL
ncbi:MAG: biofilm PGA synthesis N-glycosyltransferase PgaC [Bacteroidia bacterium]|jgi:biofilm PGA synthesis N-glycosyltransferase PgaC